MIVNSNFKDILRFSNHKSIPIAVLDFKYDKIKRKKGVKLRENKNLESIFTQRKTKYKKAELETVIMKKKAEKELKERVA